nr:venom protein [Lampona murina]
MPVNYFHNPEFLLLVLATTPLFYLTTALPSKTGVNDVDPIVNIAKGPIQGKTMKSALGKEVDAFLGIPYAKPPTGKNRFRHPQPIDPWKDTLNATAFGNSCVQVTSTAFGDFKGETMWIPNTPINEDCLTVNVFVPRPRPEASAVMVWIYGGGFFTGTATLGVYDPKILCSEENIIVVSLNYRVASLGFLYLDRHEAPGNAGMFDQLMALEWVRDNIAYFGGDPQNVTLFGESAGAGSVGLHLLSPLSRHLFNQAIMESGSPFAAWAHLNKEDSIKNGLQLAKNLNCPSDRSRMSEVIECLQSKDAVELINSEPGPMAFFEFPFRPVVDGSFLHEMPLTSLATKNFKQANILMGSNSEEGTYFIIYFLTDKFKNREDVYITREDFIDSIKRLHSHNSELGHESIAFEYTDWANPNDTIKNRDAVDKMVGDLHIACEVNKVAHGYAEAGNNVYVYYFTQRSSINPWPKWMGVMHGDEVNFVFGEPLNPAFGYTKAEGELSRRMMHYWANFARTGNPNIRPDGENEPVNWPLHSVTGREYLTLSDNSTEVGKARRVKECAFWDDYLPKLEKSRSKKR